MRVFASLRELELHIVVRGGSNVNRLQVLILEERVAHSATNMVAWLLVGRLLILLHILLREASVTRQFLPEGNLF